MGNFITTFNHGKNHINLSHFKDKNVIEFRPTELHLRTNGSVKNEPSFAFVMENPTSKNVVFGQFSLETLKKSLAELGYEINEK